MATTLYLIRHGATEANLRRPYILQGQGMDLPLAELGVAQAERVRDLLAPLSAAFVYSSPLQRARQTAEIIAGVSHVEVAAELTEGDIGRWEGKNYEQIAKEDPEAYRLFRLDPVKHGYPGGETLAGILERAAPAFAAIAARHEGRAVAIVTHQIVCRVYLASLMGLPMALAPRLRTANGGVSVVSHEQGTYSAATLNSMFHLAGVETPP